MSLLGTVKSTGQVVGRGLSVLRGAALPGTLDNHPKSAAFELQLPNPFGGEPLYRAHITLTTTHGAHGDSVRLQAHLNGCLRMPSQTHQSDGQRAALPAPAAAGTSLARRGRRAAGGVVRFGLSRLPRSLVAPLLQQRLQTWINIQASSAPLAAGAGAFIPEKLRGLMREVPRPAAGAPRIAGWMGHIDGPHPGVAQFTCLQIDQTDLPAELRGQPFNLSASVASTLVNESEQQA